MVELDREQKALRSKLKYGTTFHNTILNIIRDRFDQSEKIINQRYDAWRLSEKQHLAYVDASETDKEGRKLYPHARDIIVPYTYAVLHTRLTYFFLALATKNPLIPISGTGPNDVIPAKLNEIVIDHQLEETSGLLNIYCWLQDTERYGVGILKNVWFEDKEDKWVVNREPINLFGVKLWDRITKSRKTITTYEGNLPVNISPYNFFPDPRVNVSDVKHMEYIGHKILRSYNHMLNMERQQEYFNVNFIPRKMEGGQDKTSGVENLDFRVRANSSLAEIAGVPTTNLNQYIDDKDKGFVQLGEMYIRLVPYDYGLSDNHYPEEWIITVANDATIVKCEPSIYSSFPFSVMESNHDYAAPFNLSTPEMMKGLQDILSWLFNSHMQNVRKIINDAVVVNPYYVEMKDLLRGAPAKIIRLKETAQFLQNIDSAVKQLTISDITRAHIQDAQVVMNLIQRVTSATDNVMGMVEEVRRTATETSSTINLATSRLKMTSKLYAAMGFKPWVKRMSFNIQGLLSEKRYYKITDKTAQELGHDPVEMKNRLLVGGEDLYGNFDFQFPNLDLPIDKINTARVWKEIIADIIQNPLLAQQFDIMMLFREMLFNLGITNISDYLAKGPQPTVMPNEQVEEQARKGNIMPLNQAMGQGGGGGGLMQSLLNDILPKSNGVPSQTERMQ